MTEQEWLECANPEPMLRFLRHTGKASERQLRLFSVACCRHIWQLLVDQRSRAAVETSERYADGLADREVLQTAHGEALVAEGEALASLFPGSADDGTWREGPAREAAAWAAAESLMAFGVASLASTARVWKSGGVLEEMHAAKAAECGSQVSLLRDVVGNPFRSTSVKPVWLTVDVITLAGHIYHDRAFGCMLELADSLEAAGCTDAELLGHLLSPGPHVRGCWAVDAILGKE
jgi:hypothetical protein